MRAIWKKSGKTWNPRKMSTLKKSNPLWIAIKSKVTNMESISRVESKQKFIRIISNYISLKHPLHRNNNCQRGPRDLIENHCYIAECWVLCDTMSGTWYDNQHHHTSNGVIVLWVSFIQTKYDGQSNIVNYKSVIDTRLSGYVPLDQMPTRPTAR